jgi:39S mitochondrial ribosomal protein L46
MMTMMHSSLWIGTARGSRRCYIPILSSSSSFSTYKEEKLAAKELRRQRFEAKMDRLVRLRTRRDGRPMDVKKAEFTSWYDKRRTYHEVMDRKARQQEKEWKIEVAAVVERLPLVTPDMEPWEAEYTALRKHLDQFTWDYPSELMQSRKSDDDDDGEIIVLDFYCTVMSRACDATAR